MESSSFSGSSKRAKAPGTIAQVAHCLVDGCSADLSQCRDYHRRHKVCEVHSKTPKVTIGGREQRFCQQCSRFHSLVEFDEGKRSCRKRLDGHNRRRRKPQPEPRLDLSRQQAISGTRLVSFSAPQILPSAVVGYSWSEVVKAENEIGVVCNNQQQQLGYMDAAAAHSSCSSSSYKGVMNEVKLVQGSSDGTSVCHQPFVDPIGGSSGGTSRQRMVFSEGLNQCDGALSLLSSATPPLVDYSGLGHYHLPHETKPIAAASTLHFPEMFHHAPEGSSTPGCGSHQTLSFMWE